MGLPSSGSISIEQILTEMGRSSTSPANLRDLAAEWLSHTGNQKFNRTTNISLSLWRGETWDPFIDPPTDYLTIQPSLYDGSNLPETIPINVTSNTHWTVTEISGANATTLSRSDGSGNGRFTVSISVNNSEIRSGEIEVRAGAIRRTFNWSQSGPYIGGPGDGGPLDNNGGGNGDGSGGDGDPIDDFPTIDEGFQ
ncbi:hypothetical protein [uncultured Dokdonia sp.]|uniref:hypothetical protein n=1 Tax=uncultured Dokdonia sp. TaxID=575653 RepID=UPI00260FE7CA|nr:hypothetical protein [uncultured Dokdonia sp.]